ncbi:glycosyltransferase [Natrinema sp. DC36]|uniref:glycosyltransferase n=1 Tax=Natrinema sp. DC36 TaxID=2878680 RepID=UPI001CF0A5B3|nr:glycosyltransferase [Natrinema sp. DC36]
MNDDIAIAHKDYDTRGGGEVFCRRLAHAIDAPMYVGRRNQANEPDDAALDIHEIPLSSVDKWMIDRGGLTRTAAYALRWQAAAEDLTEYDTIIMSGNEPLWYVPQDQQTVIAYTHSTPRFMYDLYNERMDFSGLMGRLATLFNTAQRTVYESNVNRPDLWVANSDLVARRIERYWNVPEEQIRTIYPPVDTHNYNPDDAKTGEFYLHIGRLVDAKCVDEIVQAFNGHDATLLIAGDGDERARLEELAEDNIKFLGFVTEERKQELYSRAKALLYSPLNEDFGMVPIEALAAGTPVIGVKDGFTQFQVQHGENGLLYDRGAADLRATVRDFERDGVSWTEYEIAEWTRRWFGIQRFEREIREAIEDAQQRSEVVPEWDHETPQPPGELEVNYAESD